MRIASVFWFIVLCAALAADAQETRPAAPDLVDRLLKRWGLATEEVNPWAGALRDDAPVEQLLEFWALSESRERLPEPSDNVRRRLLAGCADHPSFLPELLALLPREPATADRVKAIYDDEPKWKRVDPFAREQVHDWLMMESRYFRADLIAAARAVSFRKKSGELDHEDALSALAQLDWPAALPMLRQLAESQDIHIAAVALQMLAQHAIAAKDESALPPLRDRLRKIADDRAAPPFARSRAFKVLLEAAWPGRDDWYLSLYAQPGLNELSEGYTGYASPLETMLAAEPDRFIPPVAKLLDSPDPVIRENVAWRLVHMYRAAALRPLLPALTDTKNWPEGFRGQLLRALAEVDLPESVPWMRKALPELNKFDAVSTAYALARQRAKEAPGALRALIDEAAAVPEQDRLARTLVDLKVLSDAELVDLIEASCVAAAERAGRLPHGKAEASNRADLGWHLEQLVRDRQELAVALLKRAAAVEKSTPALALQIRDTLVSWPAAAVDRDIVERLNRDNLDEETIVQAARRLPGLRMVVPQALRDMATQRGRRAGAAAALLGDATIIADILHGSDREPQAMLLAVSRLAHTHLPLDAVSVFLKSKDAQLSQAAEAFLLADGTPQARLIVQRHHSGEFLIFGGAGYFPSNDAAEASDVTTESKLMRALYNEMRGKDAPDAVYALLSGGGFGNDNQRIIRIRGGRATLSLEPGGGRVDSRDLDPAELKSLLDLLQAEKFDDQPPLHNNGVLDGVWYTYLHLTRETGRSVTMNNPGVAGTANSPHFRVASMFRTLGSVPRFVTRYNMKGVTVLWPASNGAICGVWKQGDEFRVAVAASRDEIENYTWHAFRNGKVAEVVEKPNAVTLRDGSHDHHVAPEDFDIDWGRSSPRFLALAGEDEILPGNRWGPLGGGLWRCRAGHEPVRIAKAPGEINQPIVTAGGQWVVASETMVVDDKVVQPLIRVRLADGMITPFALPPKWAYSPVARMPDGRILAMGWMRDGGNTDRPHWLVDAVTGKFERVNGDFRPLVSRNDPLQPAQEKNVVWAMESDEKGTRIGRYDLASFKFTPSVNLPELTYGASAMWVDEKEGAAFICPQGDLLRVELREAQAR